jgi:1,4-dihydroxy-2-naphthoate polyprenyltransferase
MLPLIFVSLGIAIAWVHGSFNPVSALLLIAGALCLHAGVNILNDFFDYRSGIDLITTRTPFNGGSGILPAKHMTPNKVLLEGTLFLLGGILIGGYFVATLNFSPILISLLAVAIVSVIGYSPIFAKYGLGELLAGLNFGPLLVLGTYFVLTKTVSIEPIFVGITPGILTACVLYINEFPDTNADSQKGRLHLVARWGKERSARIFKFLIGSAYAALILGVLLRVVTPFALISLFALPKAINASKILSKNYNKTMELVPGMANTVMATLWTGGLILLGYVLQGIFTALM